MAQVVQLDNADILRERQRMTVYTAPSAGPHLSGESDALASSAKPLASGLSSS